MNPSKPCRVCGRATPCLCDLEEPEARPAGARILPFRRKGGSPSPVRDPDETPPSAA